MLSIIEWVAAFTFLLPNLAAAPPASQPVQDTDKTFISLTVVSLTLNQQASDRDVPTAVVSLNQSDDLRALHKLGDLDISRPATVVTWPQQVKLASRYVPVVQEIVIGPVTVLEADCSMNGEWLTVDPKRAYVKLDVDYRYVTSTSGDPAKVISRSAQSQFTHDFLITKEERAWVLCKSAESRRYLLFGIFCARVPGQRENSRTAGPADSLQERSASER